SPCYLLFFLLLPPPPSSTLFPYTTLFRSVSGNDPSFIERSLPGLRDGGALVILATPGKPPRFSSLVGRNLSVHGSLWFPRKTVRSEEHTSELQSLTNLVCRLLLEKKKRDD